MDEKEFDSINILPLVDVVLVLLTIVLTTATFVARGLIPVELPAVERGATAHENQERILVEITPDGRVFVDSVAAELPALGNRLQAVPRDRAIVIRADKKLALEFFVRVLGMLKKDGFQNISLQTEEKT